MKGNVLEVLGLRDNKYRVTINIEGNEDLNNVSKLCNDKALCNIEIKKYREKRSLNANAYCWVLIEKLADKMGISKDDMYKRMLQDYGTIQTDSEGNKIIFSVKASIDVSKYFKYYRFLGDSHDKNFKHYYVIKGSSEYNSEEMKRFIDGIVEDCKLLDIETMTPEEIAMLEVGE